MKRGQQINEEYLATIALALFDVMIKFRIHNYRQVPTVFIFPDNSVITLKQEPLEIKELHTKTVSEVSKWYVYVNFRE